MSREKKLDSVTVKEAENSLLSVVDRSLSRGVNYCVSSRVPGWMGIQ